MTPEGKVKKQVKEILTKYNVYFTMPATHGYGGSGTPDFLCCAKGRFLGIECKAGDNVPTKLQIKNLESIMKSGGYALVINETNVRQLTHLLETFYGEKDQQVRKDPCSDSCG